MTFMTKQLLDVKKLSKKDLDAMVASLGSASDKGARIASGKKGK